MPEYDFAEKCMGTQLLVSVLSDDEKLAKEIWKDILNQCQKTEQMCSRFLPQSEISRLNQGEIFEVSDEILEIFQLAQKAFYLTHGTFNPLCSPYFFGYDSDFEQKKFSKEKPIIPTNFEDIIVDLNIKTILLPKKSHIDFGGIVKGYLAEKLAKFHAPKVHGIIVNLGGDMAAYGKDGNTDLFEMNIVNPITKEKIPFFMQNQVLCTSGTYKRHWKGSHHIIDPHILQSAQSDLISASVVHSQGWVAESVATACIVWGKEKSIAFLEKYNMQYVLIENQSSIIRT